MDFKGSIQVLMTYRNCDIFKKLESKTKQLWKSNDAQWKLVLIQQQYIEDSFTFRCVSQLKVLSSFCSIKSKAIGIDGLNPRFFEILLPKLLPYVTHVFNTILTKSTFSDEWKESKITPIPKQNNEFPPISIFPFLSKVIQNIMSEQINEYVRSHNI